MQGYLRSDGRKGIRNYVAVVYLVECAHHVAREVALPFREHGAHLVGFPGCNLYWHEGIIVQSDLVSSITVAIRRQRSGQDREHYGDVTPTTNNPVNMTDNDS